MALADGQYSYRGLTFGAGTSHPVRRVEGLEGFAARVGDRDLPRGHGAVRGKHLLSARLPLLTLRVTRPIESGWETIREAFPISEDEDHELAWKREGMPERLLRCSVIDLPRSEQVPEGVAVQWANVALRAADPRIYSTERRQLALTPHDGSGGGIDYTVDYPKDFPAGVSVDGTAHNAGKADAYPLVRFFGPTSGTATSVTVLNRTTGQELTVNTDIAAGQTLTFDGTAFVTASGGQVLHISGASRYGDWAQPREPLALVPADNVLRFTATGTTAGMLAVLDWRDTWTS